MNSRPEWIGPETYRVGDVQFSTRETDDPSSCFVMKDRHLVNAYLPLQEKQPKRILEIGTYTGGSSILLHQLFRPEKLVCIDARPDMPQSVEYVAKRAVGDTMKLYPNTSQADRQRIPEILDREFGEAPIDLIVDDASHLFAWSRACFEIVYPRLRAGGTYVLEDWGWAHWLGEYQQPDHYWAKEDALTNLLFELVLISSTRPDIISEIKISTAPASTVAALTKGSAVLGPEFSIDGSYVLRGRTMARI